MKNESFWRWLLEVIKAGCKDLASFHWVNQRGFEFAIGFAVFFVGIVVPIIEYLYWLVPIFAIGGLLIMAHAVWRGRYD